MTTLQEWLDATGRTATDVDRESAVGRTTLWRIRRGDGIVRVDIARRVRDACARLEPDHEPPDPETMMVPDEAAS